MPNTIKDQIYKLRHLGDSCGGDHICYLCQSDEEKWRVLCEFYRVGFEKHEKLMFFQHSTPFERVMQYLEEGGIKEIREYAKKGQFTVKHYSEIYITNGVFTPETMVSRLSYETEIAITEGYSTLRICGDMSWVHNEIDLTDKLIKYESLLNHNFPDNYVALCMYDIRAFKASDMLQVLSTHPQTVINEKLLQNIYYMPPEDYLGPDVSRAMLDRWMHNIEERKSIEEQLIASKIEAEKAVHAKSSFLATMSHEIRNPTNGIIGSVDLLAQTDTTTEQKEYVNIIQSSAKHLYRVVNDVLDFSKIESGKLELAKVPLKVTELLEDSLRLCQYSIQKNLNVSLRYCKDENCPETILGDETRLRQILVNLIGNACKFTEEGEVVVSVVAIKNMENKNNNNKNGEIGKEGIGERKRERNGIGIKTEGEKEEGERNEKEEDKIILEFSVTDSGAGISKKDQTRLFQKFTQFDVSRKWAGTGLGLAICKQLVEAMGGQILVKSRMGKGSTFYFRIPLSLSPSLPPSPSILPISPSIFSSTPSSTSSSSSSSPSASYPSSPFIPISSPFDNDPSSSIPNTSIPPSSSSSSSSSISSASSISHSSASSSSSSSFISPNNPVELSPREDSILEKVEKENAEEKREKREKEGKEGREEKKVKLTSSSPPTSCSLSSSLSSSSLSSSASSPISPTLDFTGNHVLVVEDDVTNQKVLTHMLKKLNCKVTIASNGFEAIRLAKENNYSLILTDQYMPECDGFAAVKQIRENYSLLSLSPSSSPSFSSSPNNNENDNKRICPPIAVCTGTYEPRLEEVMDDILIKPVRFRTISELLSRHCKPKT